MRGVRRGFGVVCCTDGRGSCRRPWAQRSPRRSWRGRHSARSAQPSSSAPHAKLDGQAVNSRGWRTPIRCVSLESKLAQPSVDVSSDEAPVIHTSARSDRAAALAAIERQQKAFVLVEACAKTINGALFPATGSCRGVVLTHQRDHGDRVHGRTGLLSDVGRSTRSQPLQQRGCDLHRKRGLLYR